MVISLDWRRSIAVSLAVASLVVAVSWPAWRSVLGAGYDTYGYGSYGYGYYGYGYHLHWYDRYGYATHVPEGLGYRYRLPPKAPWAR